MIQAVIIRFVPRLPDMKSFQLICRVGVYGSLATAAILLLYGLFGWIGSERAAAVATRHLTKMGHPPQSTPHASWSWFRWTITFDDGSFVDVSRNGDLLGGGSR
jgi:hypothetical protein